MNAILGSRDFSLFGEQGNKQIYFRETMEQVSTPGRRVWLEIDKTTYQNWA